MKNAKEGASTLDCRDEQRNVGNELCMAVLGLDRKKTGPARMAVCDTAFDSASQKNWKHQICRLFRQN